MPTGVPNSPPTAPYSPPPVPDAARIHPALLTGIVPQWLIISTGSVLVSIAVLISIWFDHVPG